MATREDKRAGRSPDGAGIDPRELEACLETLSRVDELPIDHPDAITLQRATAKLYMNFKKRRKRTRRQTISAADRAVLERTATAAPGRIDDETRGIELVSAVTGASAGTLLRALPCYVCKQRYTQVDAFYHQLCPACAVEHHERREARTDLTGRRALLTG